MPDVEREQPRPTRIPLPVRLPAGTTFGWHHVDARCTPHDEVIAIHWRDGYDNRAVSVAVAHRDTSGRVELDFEFGDLPAQMLLDEAAIDIAKWQPGAYGTPRGPRFMVSEVSPSFVEDDGEDHSDADDHGGRFASGMDPEQTLVGGRWS